MYLVTLTYLLDNPSMVIGLMDGLPAPAEIDVTNVIDPKDEQRLRERYDMP
jgi:hypothetical protein